MCLYSQQYTADQTLMSEKHVYIKRSVTFMYNACMRFLRPRDLALLNMTLRQVGASGEFGSLFGHL
jgi:hypothetical protein